MDFDIPCDTVITNICTDTRQMQKDSIFIALCGENYDGHEFVPEALANGAVLAVASKPQGENFPVIYVKDTVKAFGLLAKHYRNSFDLKLVGITGSVGKTSTKEMIFAVLAVKYKTFKTKANLNNEIGVPKTIFELNNSYDTAVIEMGMSNLGEISRLSQITNPQVGVVTNIGVSHIENLKSREGILQAKLEISDGMEKGTPLILNGDNDMLTVEKISKIRPNILDKHPVIYFGINNQNCDITAQNISCETICDENNEYIWRTNFFITYKNIQYKACIPCVGEHNIYNALAAFGVGISLGLTPQEIITGYNNYKTVGARLNIIQKDNIIIIDDCYNSSPDSVKAALSVMQKIAKGRKIAILGDMLELGKMSEELHLQTGKNTAEYDADIVICQGEQAKHIANGAKQKGIESHWFETQKEVVNFLHKTITPKDTILFKASRGMKFELIIEDVFLNKK